MRLSIPDEGASNAVSPDTCGNLSGGNAAQYIMQPRAHWGGMDRLGNLELPRSGDPAGQRRLGSTGVARPIVRYNRLGAWLRPNLIS